MTKDGVDPEQRRGNHLQTSYSLAQSERNQERSVEGMEAAHREDLASPY